MTGMPPFPSIQIRLARHYLDKLRLAAQAVSRGRSNLAYGLSLFDQEWPQIQYWQAWSAQYSRDFDEWAQICKEFPFAGSDVLSIRHTPVERRVWWEAALQAAQRLQDRQAERAILPKLAMALSGLGDLEKTGQYARRLLELAQDAQDPLHIGRALYHLGTILEDLGEHAEAIHHYKHSLKIFEEHGLEVDRGRALLGLGSVATITGDYQDAYAYFLEYLKIVEVGGKESDLCIALLAVSEALRYLKRYDEAVSYLERSIQLCRALDYRWGLGPSLIALGVCIAEQGHLESANQLLEEGVRTARAFGAKRDIIYGLSSLGYVRYRRDQISEAAGPLREALTLAREAGMPYFTCYIQRNLAYVYLVLNSLDSARQALHESLTIARDLALLPETIKALTCAVAYGHRLGRSEQAATWAGFLHGSPEVDLPDFQPVCAGLELALSARRYREMFERGKTLTLEGIISDVLVLTAPDSPGDALLAKSGEEVPPSLRKKPQPPTRPHAGFIADAGAAPLLSPESPG